jgi:hypothetical protein
MAVPDPSVAEPDWGYDVADYFDVDATLGSIEHLNVLVREADARGIRILRTGPEPHELPPPQLSVCEDIQTIRPSGLVRVGGCPGRAGRPRQASELLVKGRIRPSR